MLITTLQDYWTLVSAHREGDDDVLMLLEFLTEGHDKVAQLSRSYLASVAAAF